MCTNSTTVERIVWEGAEGRAVVVRHGYQDYEARLDGRSCGYFKYSFQAEHELAVLLEEQARELAIQFADEAAERDAEADDVVVQVAPVRCEVTGEELGSYYRMSGLDIFVAHEPAVLADAEPMVFLPGKTDGLPLSVFERVLPLVQAITSDPRFQAACTLLGTNRKTA